MKSKPFPRFGLTPFAKRFPENVDKAKILIGGDVETSVQVCSELERVSRVEQCSDFHCVTTWTRRGLQWGGIRFADFYRQVVVPVAGTSDGTTVVVLEGSPAAEDGPMERMVRHPNFVETLAPAGFFRCFQSAIRPSA